MVSSKMKDQEPVKYMDIQEFLEEGYLQEANRQFFHPLGLALEVCIDTDTGQVVLSGVQDRRDDDEGIQYNQDFIDTKKARQIKELQNSKAEIRKEKLGYVIQPVE